MPRRRKQVTPLKGLFQVLWQQPLFAIPFAVFFGTLYGNMPGSMIPAYAITLVFAYCVGITIWAVEHFVRPHERAAASAHQPMGWLRPALTYGLAAIGASIVAALIIDATLMPGFVRGGRSIAMILMFSVLFCVLFMGISVAINFHKASLDQAKSEHELNLARRIQRSFLLSNFPEHARLEVHAVNVSSRHVSGDFYDVVGAGDDTFLLAIADVAGKGVPAALMSSMLQASLRTQAPTIPSVAAILRNINALVYRSTAVHQFATFFLARVDERRLALSYSNAGHNFPLLFRRSGERLTLERGGTVVGILEGADFEEDTVLLAPGDRVVLYTDGISEAANAAGELYGEERLIALIEGLAGDLTAREVTERILEGVRGFLAGEEAGDDMTLLVLRVLDPVPAPDGRPAALVASAS